MNSKNIILVGFMGSGKTTIGKRVAKALTEKYCNYRFIDMDNEIEKKTGMKISFIFEKFGEEYFRELETELCEELSNTKLCVIATGGGVIKSKNNMTLLKKSGIVVYLKANTEHIYRNIKDDTSRPLLQCDDKISKIKQLLEDRKPLYEGLSDIIVDVSGINSKDAAAMIISKIEGDNLL